MVDNPAPTDTTPPGASLVDIGTILNQLARNGGLLNQTQSTLVATQSAQLSLLTQTMSTQISLLTQTISAVLPRAFGSFTLANATVTNITQPAVHANSFISLTPTNSSAANSIIIVGLFLAAQTAGVGFTMSTVAGSATGLETFSYAVFTPA